MTWDRAALAMPAVVQALVSAYLGAGKVEAVRGRAACDSGYEEAVRVLASELAECRTERP